MKRQVLTKSKLMEGYRCPKALHLRVFNPKAASPIDETTQARFDEGHLVGNYAKKQFPNGFEIQAKPWEYDIALQATQKAIANQSPVLFEAAFEFQNVFVRADIMQFNPETQKFKIYEVKSSTSVKPEHITDLALQTWVMAKNNIPIESISLMHINKECIYPDLDSLFSTVDLTQEMRDLYNSIPQDLNSFSTVLQNPSPPNQPIGPHCTASYDCAFKPHCFDQAGVPSASVLDISGLKSEDKWHFFHQGIKNIEDLPLTELSDFVANMVRVHKTGKMQADVAQIKNELESWQYPLHFFDFETIMFAIPRFNQSRPYQQIPFQYSLHMQAEKDGPLTHFEYLHTTNTDPRPLLIEKMLSHFQKSGSIVAYYQSFEVSRIKELARDFPQYEAELEALIPRFKDLHPLIKNHLYHKDFGGGFGLKKTAPALLGQQASYDDLEIQSGNLVQTAYNKMTHPSLSSQEKSKLENNLLAYCKQDTQVMIDLLNFLQNLH